MSEIWKFLYKNRRTRWKRFIRTNLSLIHISRVNADTTARMGDKVKFIMDMEKVHIFDKETGIVITN